jgi:hypothetical protein
VLIQAGLRARPAAASTSIPNGFSQLIRGNRLVFSDKAPRTLIGWLAAFTELPEGIAAPYAGSLRAGAVATGLNIASGQVGAFICTPFFTKRIGQLTRLRWMGSMAACACGALILMVTRPGLVISLVILGVSGSFTIYQIAANTAFVQRVPDDGRAQAFGLANAGMMVGQGIAFAAAGAACELVPPATVIAVGGGVGTVIAIYLALRWRGMSLAVGWHSARHLASLTGESALAAPPRPTRPLPVTFPAGSGPLSRTRLSWTSWRNCGNVRASRVPAAGSSGAAGLSCRRSGPSPRHSR